MEDFSIESLSEAKRVLSSLLSKCEKVQVKFLEGTSQHTLLKNRIKAVHIALSLIEREMGQGISL